MVLETEAQRRVIVRPVLIMGSFFVSNVVEDASIVGFLITSAGGESTLNILVVCADKHPGQRTVRDRRRFDVTRPIQSATASS